MNHELEADFLEFAIETWQQLINETQNKIWDYKRYIRTYLFCGQVDTANEYRDYLDHAKKDLEKYIVNLDKAKNLLVEVTKRTGMLGGI